MANKTDIQIERNPVAIFHNVVVKPLLYTLGNAEMATISTNLQPHYRLNDETMAK